MSFRLKTSPKKAKNAYVHTQAVVTGEVVLKDHANIWPGAVLRADLNKIVVGRYSNIQDVSVLHVEDDKGCYVGDYCVVGHRVILHACRVGNGVLIGMGSIVLNGAKIGDGAIIGAGSLVTEEMRIKPRSLYFGSPARFIRKLTEKEVRATILSAKKYAELADKYKSGAFS